MRTAIATVSDSVLKGSLMSAAQRRDFVLDRLVVEATEAKDSARVAALALLAKSAGLLTEQQDVVSKGNSAMLRDKLQSLIDTVSRRPSIIDATDVSNTATFKRDDDMDDGEEPAEMDDDDKPSRAGSV